MILKDIPSGKQFVHIHSPIALITAVSLQLNDINSSVISE